MSRVGSVSVTLDTMANKPTATRHHPWYKERLDLKFLKTYNPSASLDGEKWVFLANDIDDFRSNLPAQTEGAKMVIKKRVNQVPLLLSSAPGERKDSSSSNKTTAKQNPGRLTLFSRMGPRRQLNGGVVDMKEAELLQHALTLYPHLRDSIPAQLREDIVHILEPDQKLPSLELESGLEQPAVDTRLFIVPEKHEEPNIYCWPLIKTKEEKLEEQARLASQKVISPAQESKVNDVTCQLVQWVKALGGNEDINIDETMVKNLFASDLETKLSIAAPVEVVELTSVPLELASRSRGAGHSPSNLKAAIFLQDTANLTGVPHLVRTRYGAWYLPITLWERKLQEKPLSKLRHTLDNMGTPINTVQEDVLHNLHGARAFKEFLLSKPGAIMPQFLAGVKPRQTQRLSLAL